MFRPKPRGAAAPHSPRSAWLALCLAGCAQAGTLESCLEPPVTDTAEAQGVISGTVVYQGAVPPAVDGRPAGNVIIFVYDEAAPPPPQGAGRPVTFAIVPRATLFRDGSANGFHSAPFSIPLVPPGRYVIRALLDVDGDFDPFVLPRASASRGDVGGGALDVTAVPPRFEVVEVRGGAEVRGVTLTLSATQALFAADAPAVTLPDGATLSPASTVPTRFRLQAIQLSANAPEVTAQDLSGNGTPGLLVELGDADADGVADDADGDGLVDVYPRVLLRRIADDSATLLADDAALATIPCAVDPTSFLGAWPPPSRVPAVGMWVPAVDVLCLPLAVDARTNPPTPLPSIPPGRYALLLVSRMGQVWRIPNDYGPAAGPVARGILREPLASQGAWVTVPDHALPTGALEGRVLLDVAPTGTTWVFVFAADAPPPPAGTGTPLASTRVPPEAFTPTGAGWEAAYRVERLGAGDVLVAALADMDRNFDLRVDRLSQATQGDWVAAPSGPHRVETAPIPVDVHVDTPIPTDPPVFAAHDLARVTLGRARQSLALDAVPPDNALVNTGRTGGFLAGWRTGGAAPVDGDGDGVPDLWPRAVLSRVVADPADASGVGADRRVVLVSAVDPVPMAMALGNTAGALVATSRLDVAILPSAVDATDPSNPQPLGSVPAGTYALTLLDRTGQFARPLAVNPDLAALGYALPDGTLQAVAYAPDGLLVDVPAITRPTGGVEGTLRVVGAGVDGPAWVFVFSAEDPGPPDGAGLPAAVARVQASAFMDGGNGTMVAPWSASGLAPGEYTVSALLDVDRNFSLLLELRGAATAGDVLGVHVAGDPARPSSIVVGTGTVAGVDVALQVTAPTGPPAFELLSPPGTLDAPRSMTLRALSGADPAVSPGGAVDLDVAERTFAVTLRDADGDGAPDDADGDGIPDLYPRVLLHAVDADGRPSTGASAARIPASPDPSRYLPALLGGMPAVVTDTLSLQVLPLAVMADGTRGAVVAGSYGVTAMTAAGQVWRVPNALAPGAAQAGGGVASQGQVVAVQVGAGPGPRSMGGTLVVPAGVCGRVVVLARPATGGALAALEKPAALDVLEPVRSADGTCQAPPSTWSLGGLRAGRYVVQAFSDVAQRFQPFLGTRAGPSAGDVAGGHLDAAAAVLEAVDVADVDLQDVTVTLGAALPLDRPAFRFDAGWPTGGTVVGGAVRTALVVAGEMNTPLGRVGAATNAFTTSVDMAGAGQVTWPMVMLVRLDEADPRGLRFREPLEVVPGDVDESQFTGVTAARVEVVFPPTRVDALQRPVAPALPGRYAVVVINRDGGKWQVPNELSPALSITGMGLAGSAGQGAAWTWQ